MNIKLIEHCRDDAKMIESLWFNQHRDAETDKDTNDFGWLYIHAKQLREKLDAMLASVESKPASDV